MNAFLRAFLFDFGMLLLGLLPFIFIYVDTLAVELGWRGSILEIVLYLMFVPTLFAFPLVAIFYFIWRFKSIELKSFSR